MYRTVLNDVNTCVHIFARRSERSIIKWPPTTAAKLSNLALRHQSIASHVFVIYLSAGKHLVIFIDPFSSFSLPKLTDVQSHNISRLKWLEEIVIVLNRVIILFRNLQKIPPLPKLTDVQKNLPPDVTTIWQSFKEDLSILWCRKMFRNRGGCKDAWSVANSTAGQTWRS